MTTPTRTGSSSSSPIGGDQHRPAEERNPVEAHPGRSRRQHRRGQRQGDGGEADDEQHEGGEVQVDHLRVAASGPTVGPERDDDEHEPAEPCPEPGRRQLREGQRAGADLQRDDRQGDAEQQRGEHAEHQPDAVGGEQLRQRTGVEQRVGARSTRSSPSSTPTTAVAARASTEQPTILMPVTLESADVIHAAVAATAPVPPATAVPGGDVAMESGLMSVVLIRGAGGGGARRRRSSDAGRTLPVPPRGEPKSSRGVTPEPGRRRSGPGTAPSRT